MAAKKLSPDTAAIIVAIQNATGVAEATAKVVSDELQRHTAQDDERFANVTKLVESIAIDVKSLLGSRSFMRGAWKGITVSALVASTLVTGIHAWWGTVIAYLKGLH